MMMIARPISKDVLIVDDDNAIRSLIHTSMSRAGLTCDVAADGVEALEHLATTVYSVLLLDLMMPRMDGPALLRQLRTRGYDGDRPVVLILTASSDRESLTPVAELVQVVIRKPFEVHELSDLVRDCVAARKRQSEDQQEMPTPRPAPPAARL